METPILELPIFVRDSLYFVSSYPENLIHLVLTVQKLKIFVASFERDSHFGTPKFCQILSFLYI